MDICFHSFGIKAMKPWSPVGNKTLLTNLKTHANNLHVFIDAPINHSKEYEQYNYCVRKDIEQVFDIIWESPMCINNAYSMTQPRNQVLICKVKKEFQ